MHGTSTRKGCFRLALGFCISIGLLVACDPNQVNQNLGRKCYDAGSGSNCLTYKTWADNIESRIAQKAVGYSFIIINSGLAMETRAFGKARLSPDVAMTADQRSNAASVTKTMTATAALKLLAAKNVSVTSSISPYLPSGWTLGNGVKAITFAELMTHTSGIRTPANTGTDLAGLKKVLAQDITTKAYQYDNNNFALFRILFTYLNGYNDAGKTDDEIDAATQQGYLKHMKSAYEPDIAISCTAGNGAVMSYPYPPGNANGNTWGDWSATCGGGGLQLTVTDMGVFLTRLLSGAYLPKASNNPVQVTLPDMVSNQYGWDATWPKTHGTCVMKNGDLGGGNPFVPILSTLYVYCPETGLAFVGLANSTLPSMPVHNYGFSGALDDIVYQAYEASWQPGP